jgi:hypothetical protein
MRCYGATVLGLVGFLAITSERALAYSCMGVQSAPIDFGRLRNAIDPKHEMSDSDRNMAAVGALYQYKMKQGDTDGAACAAFQMIQYYRNASSRYAALAAVAAQKGDLDTATHAAVKAYANIPNGKNFQVQRTPDGKLSYTMTDMSTGRVTMHGIEPPDKLAAAAMDLGRGDFDKTLLAAAEAEIAARAAGGRSMVSGNPNAALNRPPAPVFDMPIERSQKPMNCFTTELGGGMSTTNCN